MGHGKQLHQAAEISLVNKKNLDFVMEVKPTQC